MNILPPEVTNLLKGSRRWVVSLLGITGLVAFLEALAVANMLFLSHAILGQETPSLLGGTFIDRLLSGYSQRVTLGLLGVAFIVITISRYGLFMGYRYLGYKWLGLVAGNLHKRIMNRVISAQLQLFSERQLGEIIHGLFVAPVGAGVAIESMVSGMSAIFLIVAVSIMLVVISPWLFLAAAIVGLLFFVTIVRPSRTRVGRYQQQGYESQSKGSEIAADVINGIRDIRVVAAEPKWEAAFAKEIDRWQTARRSTQFHAQLPAPTLQMVLQVLFAGAVVTAAFTLSSGGLETQLPLVGVFAYGLLRVFPAVVQLGATWISLAQALPNLRAAAEWTESPLDTLATGTIEAPSLRKGIRFQGVSFSYNGDIPALIDADFHIEAGKITALVGASGAGKSTLIDLMLKFRAPEQGTVWLDGEDLAAITRQSWLDQVGLVRQDVFLFAGTIRSNLLAWQSGASEEEMRQACEQAGILDFINRLPNGLDALVGDRGVTFSGGQRQRLAMARALLRDPKFLILDEATSALDGETETRVLESLFNGSKGRTTLVISHRLSAVRNANHIIVMDQGRVVEQGTHQELLERNCRYWELFSTQIGHESVPLSDVRLS